jgi:RNA polymerase sigma factor (sigma-70 family)
MHQNNLSENARAFINILGGMSEQDKTILIDRFFKKRTLKSVSQKIGMSEVRVQQIEDKLIDKIDQIFNYINL